MVILLDCELITTIGLREMFGPAKGHVLGFLAATGLE